MFPENTKEHSMKTRNIDMYQVQHDNAGRLQDSAIIYMQKLLNDYTKNKQSFVKLPIQKYVLGEFLSVPSVPSL